MSGRSAFRIWLLNEINDILQGGKGIRKLVSRNSAYIKESDVDSLTEKIWPSMSAVNLIKDLYNYLCTECKKPIRQKIRVMMQKQLYSNIL